MRPTRRPGRGWRRRRRHDSFACAYDSRQVPPEPRSMKRSLMPLALACALVACGDDTPREKPAKPAPAATAPTSGEDPQAASGNTRVTVYSGDYQTLAAGHGGSETGYALVSRDLHFELKAGRNSVAVKDLPQAIDVAATSLRPATSGVTVGA